MTATLLAVGAASVGAGLLLAPGATRLAVSTASRRPRGLRLGPGGMVLALAVGTLALGTQVGLLPMLVVAGLVALVLTERSRGRRRAGRMRTVEACEEYVMSLAAELSAGRTAAEALSAAASLDAPGAAKAARVAALGGDPTEALRVGAAAHAGAGSLTQVAAAWQVAAATGAPLADVLRRTSLVVRDEVAAMREVDEQMAPVRATGRVLALLPVVGVMVGGAFGVNVPVLLATTSWGQFCLLAALGLVATGLLVIDRIGERVARP